MDNLRQFAQGRLQTLLNINKYTINDIKLYMEDYMIPTDYQTTSYYHFGGSPNIDRAKILSFINMQNKRHKLDPVTEYNIDDLRTAARYASISIYYDEKEILECILMKFIQNCEKKNSQTNIEDIKKKLREYKVPILSNDPVILNMQLNHINEIKKFDKGNIELIDNLEYCLKRSQSYIYNNMANPQWEDLYGNEIKHPSNAKFLQYLKSTKIQPFCGQHNALLFQSVQNPDHIFLAQMRIKMFENINRYNLNKITPVNILKHKEDLEIEIIDYIDEFVNNRSTLSIIDEPPPYHSLIKN